MNQQLETPRDYSALDGLIGRFDRFLRAAVALPTSPARPSPAAHLAEAELSPRERRRSGRLMRVNHTGEVCAQALYLGQALAARERGTEDELHDTAAEENDHLIWCAERLTELHTHTSRLNPAWFCGSVVIGISAALVGDRHSLGFVEETERQVCAHLDGHLEKISVDDIRSRAIIRTMRDDEARHAQHARDHGARDLRPMVKKLMKLQARVMTTLAHWI